MGLIRTYLDAGVLIYAARSASVMGVKALAILDDQAREFVASDYQRLELVPKAQFHRSSAELKFYKDFFLRAVRTVPFRAAHFETAFRHACDCGLSAFDALHLTAAVEAECEEFITSERRSSPLFRFSRVTIRTLLT